MKAAGNVRIEITHLDGRCTVATPIAAIAFDDEEDARGFLEDVAFQELRETRDACSVVAYTSAYPEVWAEAYDQGDGVVVMSGAGPGACA
ncbi:MAG TPA: hypothetical protein VIL43_10690 [Burkholderiales bacterium]